MLPAWFEERLMLNTNKKNHTTTSANLVFMRRRQAVELLLSLAEEPEQSLPAKNLLLDSLYQLPTECFIADDWHLILHQITESLLLQEHKNGAGMPTHLSSLLAKIQQRLSSSTH